MEQHCAENASDDSSKLNDQDKEIEHFQKQIEFQSRSLERLKTIRTGKRKIIEILRNGNESMDKKLMAQLHERYNDFVRQEAEILVLLQKVTGFASNHTTESNNDESDGGALSQQIAETKAKLAVEQQKNKKLERLASKKNENVQSIMNQRDLLQQQVAKIQEENVAKKDLYFKLLNAIQENPKLANKLPADAKCGLTTMEVAQSTPGTSSEYNEIKKHLESIETRRLRMQNLREQLYQATTTQKMDDAYGAALKRLTTLTEIRNALEDASTEADNTAADVEDRHSITSVQLVNDEDEDEGSENETPDRNTPISNANSDNQKAALVGHVESVDNDGTQTDTERVQPDTGNNGVEKEICLVIEHIVPWINEHAENSITIELASELQELVTAKAESLCFPDNRAPEGFKTQLSTVIDEILGKFYSQTFNQASKKMLSEISEVLYNELPVFKLMKNVNAVSVS